MHARADSCMLMHIFCSIQIMNATVDKGHKSWPAKHEAGFTRPKFSYFAFAPAMFLKHRRENFKHVFITKYSCSLSSFSILFLSSIESEQIFNGLFSAFLLRATLFGGPIWKDKKRHFRLLRHFRDLITTWQWRNFQYVCFESFDRAIWIFFCYDDHESHEY